MCTFSGAVPFTRRVGAGTVCNILNTFPTASTWMGSIWVLLRRQTTHRGQYRPTKVPNRSPIVFPPPTKHQSGHLRIPNFVEGKPTSAEVEPGDPAEHLHCHQEEGQLVSTWITVLEGCTIAFGGGNQAPVETRIWVCPQYPVVVGLQCSF